MNFSSSAEPQPWYKIKKIDDLKIQVFFSDFETSIKHLYFFHLKLMSEYTKVDKQLNIFIYKGLNSRSAKRASVIKKYIKDKHNLSSSRVTIVSDFSKKQGFILEGERIEVFMTRKSLDEINIEIANRAKNFKETESALVIKKKSGKQKIISHSAMPQKKGYFELKNKNSTSINNLNIAVQEDQLDPSLQKAVSKVRYSEEPSSLKEVGEHSFNDSLQASDSISQKNNGNLSSEAVEDQGASFNNTGEEIVLSRGLASSAEELADFKNLKSKDFHD